MGLVQKANRLSELLQKLAGEFRQENRPHTASHVDIARIELMASPDSAARLYDMLKGA